MSFRELALPEQLLLARRGTSYFAQRLAELDDDELDADTLLPGWTRRHLLAHVGYNAAALCRLMDWAATGNETPMYESTEQRNREIEEGSTQNAAALRNLFDHTVARLDEKWRHVNGTAWEAEVRTAQGRTVPASETIWLRTREVWIHAVDLRNNGRFADFPTVVSDSLLNDIIAMWRTRSAGSGLIIEVDRRPPITVDESVPTAVTVTGDLSSVVRWASGRGRIGVTIEGDPAEPPRWL